MSGSPTVQPSWQDDIWAGTALFCAMYYIVSVNTAVLSSAGLPESAVVFGTFLAIIVGNLLGMAVTGTGLMIAPGIGLSYFIANLILDFRKASDNSFGWGDAMLGGLLAGAFLIATTTLTDWRSRIIRELPEPVRRGANAAIGSLLVATAFRQFRDLTGPHWGIDPFFATCAMSGAVTILFVFFFIRRSVVPTGTGVGADALKFVLRIEFILAIAVSAILLHVFQPDYIARLPVSTSLTWLWLEPGAFSEIHFGPSSLFIWPGIAFVIWFMIITDAPGTPSLVLPDEYQANERGRAIRGGYIADAISALLAPIFGTTPTIYYAENNLLRDFGSFSWQVELMATGWFTLSLVAVATSFVSVDRLLPPFAVLPAVFYIGLLIISVSFLEKPATTAAPAVPRTIKSFIPAAVAVALTPNIGLEFAFPLSVISYWFVGGSPSADGKPEHGPSFVWITCGAVALLFVMFMIEVVFPTLP